MLHAFAATAAMLVGDVAAAAAADVSPIIRHLQLTMLYQVEPHDLCGKPFKVHGGSINKLSPCALNGLLWLCLLLPLRN